MKRSILILLGLSAWGQNRLEIAQPVQSRLDSGQTQAYLIELKRNQYIEVAADQTGVDVVLRLMAPNGKQLEDVNFLGVGGTELLIHLAGDDGVYRLEVGSAQPDGSGLYTLRMTPRMATTKDLAITKADARLQAVLASKLPDSADPVEQLASEFAGLGMKQRQAVA